MVDSKTHGTSKVDPDHQAILKAASEALVKMGYAVSTKYPATTSSTQGGTTSGGSSSIDDGVVTKISPLTKVNYLADSTYYHDNLSCSTYASASGTKKSGTYEDVKGRKLCDKCKSDYVYYAIKGWYHYEPDCTPLKPYDTIYKIPTDSLDSTWKHTCTECKP